MNTLPFILLFVTFLLVLPGRFMKKKHQKYTDKMKEFVWIDNFMDVTKDELKTHMVDIDNELSTTSIREETFNYYADQFVTSLIEDLNNATIANAGKIKKLDRAKSLLKMNFEVKALEKIDEAKNKLKGNVSL